MLIAYNGCELNVVIAQSVFIYENIYGFDIIPKFSPFMWFYHVCFFLVISWGKESKYKYNFASMLLQQNSSKVHTVIVQFFFHVWNHIWF